MIGRKRLLRVIAVLSVAVATGQTVENMRESAAPQAAEASPLASRDRLSDSASLFGNGTGQMPDLRGITSVAAASERRDRDSCRPSMALSATQGAMLEGTVTAPCNAGERVVIRHSGLAFTVAMDADGRRSFSLPALEREALVAAYFEGSAVALASVDVPEVATLARFVFQAPYPLDFKLLATAGNAARAPVGQVVTLGTATVAQPMLAQVYTFPAIDLGSSRLSVEIRVTDQTCGRSFVAETRISQGGGVTGHSLPIELPICGTAGNILLLNNLDPHLTLAAPM